MKVKDLIKILLEEPMDNEVYDSKGNEIIGLSGSFFGQELDTTYLKVKE